MSFKQYLPADIAGGLDETYRTEAWAADYPGKAYYERHIAIIEQYETAAALFREFLSGGGLRILESGCGTGRWMAYFEMLGNRAVGVDDSRGPLEMARQHDADMQLVRANALATPFRAHSFDAAFSSYVAEHFEQGPEPLFREIHRVLKPGGFFFVVVPFNNSFRRWVVNPTLRLLYLIRRLQGQPLGFTEFRYAKHEMDTFLARTNFEVLRVLPDDFRLPWSKGLFVDLSDVGCFFRYVPPRPYEFGRFGTRVRRLIHRCGPWQSCAGIFYVARARP